MDSLAKADEDLKNLHIFMVSFPGQGHVNPLLRLGKRLARFGLFVTFSAPEAAGSSIRRANAIVDDDEPTPMGRGAMRFEFFEDGLDLDGLGPIDPAAYMAQLERVGREKLPQMIMRQAARGRPVSCLINNPFIPWVSDVAESLNIPSAMLWVQSCACFSIYYHYHHKLADFPTEREPEIDVELPFLPLLKPDEIPSFLHPKSPFRVLGEVILGQFENLSKPFCILMETFRELENETIEYMSRLISRPIRTIGPLFKGLENGSACDKHSAGNESNGVRVDFFAAEKDCMEWLDAKPPGTVVYISFGSVVHHKQEQMDEIAHGLLLADVSFLWVLRPPAKGCKDEPHVLPEGFMDRAGGDDDKGRIVQWAPQEEVLAHPATACFVTHCGWNSTMEAMASGIPMVAWPQNGDQVTDAKFLVDVFKVGVRLSRGEAEGRIVGRDEVARCLRAATCDPEAAELRENATKWKKAADEAVAEGGSSYSNMEEFVHEIARIGRNK